MLINEKMCVDLSSCCAGYKIRYKTRKMLRQAIFIDK